MPFDTNIMLERTLLAHIAERLVPKVSLGSLQEVLATLKEHISISDAINDVAVTARQITSGHHDGLKCVLMGTISDIGHREQLVSGFSDSFDYLKAKVLDRDGDTIPLLPVVQDDLKEALAVASKKGAPVRLFGTVLSLPRLTQRSKSWGLDGGSRDMVMMLTAVHEHYSHLDAMAATDDERTQAAEMIVRADGKSLELLCTILAFALDIVGTEGSRMHELLRWTVIQALGCGQINHTPGNIHMFLVGPPGQGKKLISLAAQILHPTSEEVMPGRSTVAGLMGHLARSDGGWSVIPGAFARATGGVAIMQDVHTWSFSKVREIAPILQHVLEDGEIRSGGMAGGQTSSARTSLLLDTNRTTDLIGSRKVPPILNALPLLSRIDLPLEIQIDLQDSWDTGAKMLTHPAHKSRNDKTRMIKAVVATLRDRHATVDLSAISGKLRSGFEDLPEHYSEFFVAHPDIANALPRRLAISVQKIASAAARAGNRSEANDDDADIALSAAKEKMDFIAKHVVHLSTCQDGAPNIRSWLRTKEGIVNPTKLAAAYEAETGCTVCPRTVSRVLKDWQCQKKGHGLFQLPKPSADKNSE